MASVGSMENVLTPVLPLENVLTPLLPLENVLTPVLHPLLPRLKADRTDDTYYSYDGKPVFWTGKYLKCQHLRLPEKCVDCSGSQICEHKKQKQTCVLCKGSQICEHGISKGHCRTCSGRVFCEHDCRRTVCKKCHGSQICEHNRVRTNCIPCKGPSICEHDQVRLRCRICKGSAICEHNVHKYSCRHCGSAYCEHGKMKHRCPTCTPNGYLLNKLRSRVQAAMKHYSEKKKKHTIEYLGCTLEELRVYLERQFTDVISWENQGAWHLDHRRPCSSFDFNSEEEIHKCFHYTNLQPLWASENLSKNDKYDEATFPWKWVVDHWEPK